MPTTSRSAQALTAAERRAEVVRLRRSRMSFREIGAALGVSEQRAWRIYQEALRRIPAGELELHRREELDLIDSVQRGLLEIAWDASKSPRYRVEAFNGVLRASERRSRLLGLDAPAKRSVEVIETSAVDKAIADLERDLLAQGVSQEELAAMRAGSRPRMPREPSRAELDGAGPA